MFQSVQITGLLRTFLSTMVLCCLVTPAFTAPAIAQPELTINSVRIGSHPDKTRMVIEVSKAVDFKAFTSNDPYRLTISLPPFAWRAALGPAASGPGIKAIRPHTNDRGKAELILDLQRPARVQKAFLLPAQAPYPNRIVIDFKFESKVAKPSSSPYSENPAQILRLPPEQADQESRKKDWGKPAEASPPYNEPALDQARADIPEVIAPVKPIKGKKPLIVIDPGHGGQDPGAIAVNGTKEKDIALAAAKELKRQLEESGRYRVHLTRSSDVFIRLQDRVKIARTKEADMFISLHADSIDKPGVRGASIYTLSNKASDEQTEKLAARENRADLIAGVDLSHEDKDVANILIDLAMRDTMNQSKFFANIMVKQANNGGIDLLERPHRFAGFAVLKAPDIPSVLIEMGFMSNKQEVNQLTSPAYRRKMAAAIAASIDRYFEKVQKNALN
jgi:N-acetylmuramoyl-L-alanine amidase